MIENQPKQEEISVPKLRDDEVKLLGVIRDATGAEVLPDKVSSVIDFYNKQLERLRVHIAHSLPYTLSIHMNKTITQYEAVKKLKIENPDLFEKLPNDLKYMEFPSELYSTAVEYALTTPASDFNEDMEKIPAIEWLEDDLKQSGLNEKIINRVLNNIVLRMAQIRTQRRDKIFKMPEVDIQGEISPEAFVYGESSGDASKFKAWEAILIEILSLAFEACNRKNQNAEDKKKISIRLDNQTKTMEIDANVEFGKASNFSERLIGKLIGNERVNNIGWQLIYSDDPNAEYKMTLAKNA